MKTGLYYYVRSKAVGSKTTKRGVPVVTVCLTVNGNGIPARGLSICSPKDTVCKKEGRKIALAMARRAMGTGKDIKIKGVDAIRNVALYDLDTQFAEFKYQKSSFNPTLTAYEQKLLSKMGC